MTKTTKKKTAKKAPKKKSNIRTFRSYDSFLSYLDNYSSAIKGVPPAKNPKDVMRSRSIALAHEKWMQLNCNLKQNIYALNASPGHLEIPDLGLMLPPKQIFCLSGLPTYKLKASRNLEVGFRNGLLKFVTAKEIEKAGQCTTAEEDFGLKIYDRIEDAVSGMSKDGFVDLVDVGYWEYENTEHPTKPKAKPKHKKGTATRFKKIPKKKKREKRPKCWQEGVPCYDTEPIVSMSQRRSGMYMDSYECSFVGKGSQYDPYHEDSVNEMLTSDGSSDFIDVHSMMDWQEHKARLIKGERSTPQILNQQSKRSPKPVKNKTHIGNPVPDYKNLTSKGEPWADSILDI